MKTGIAYLVGAGPGDPGLLTLRGRELIEQADVVIYDYLSNEDFLKWARPDAEIIYAGKSGRRHTLTQDQINQALVDAVSAGKKVVRLKGGDPYVFGRGGEEAEALVEKELAFEVVPGVTSAIAAPAYAGIPVTHRDFTSLVTFITGHEDPTKENSALDWQALARLKGTRIFLMGVERIRDITGRLLAEGAPSETPVALVRWGTRPEQQTLIGTLGTIADQVQKSGFKAPAITIIGEVVGLRKKLNWFEKRPLFGKRIVVTRTRTQASALSAKLKELGADVLEIPTMRVVGRTWDSSMKQVGQELDRNCDWLVFTSPNGVEYFFKEFFKEIGDIRKLGTVKIAAVGPATAKKLNELHLRVEKQPDEFTVKALAAAFDQKEIRGKKILLARGNLADPQLVEHLQSHGALVSEWVVYDTFPETEDASGAQKEFQEKGADWVTFTSSSTVRFWDRLNLKGTQNGVVRYASIGPATSEAMKEFGYPVHIEAQVHTIPGLVDALLKANK